MTTIVQVRPPLQVLSMSNKQLEPRRKSKRLAEAAVYDEQDGDFHFTRGPKRAKKTKEDAEPEVVSAPVTTVSRKTTRGKQTKERETDGTNAIVTEAASTTTNAISKKPSRRKSSLESADGEPQLIVAKRPTRGKSTRATAEKRGSPETRSEQQDDGAADVGAAGRRGGASANTPAAVVMTPVVTDRKPSRKRGGATGAAQHEQSPEREQMSSNSAVEGTQIALPMSDTPIINRNKEMRKKGGAGSGSMGGARRSSMGMRGRRASSLIEAGYSAIPHRDVGTEEFYKHIEAEGLMEPRRMRQLMTWCGERALSDKPPHGTKNANALLGARAIQDQLLKDFASNAEFSDWFSREEGPSKKVKLKPNPRNIELDAKIAELEGKISRLREERKIWLALKKPPPQIPPLQPIESPSQLLPPDAELLDPEEARMLTELTFGGADAAAARGAQAQQRLRAVQAALEFGVDRLADGVHKLDQRVATAGREADAVLAMTAARLKSREERERAAAGTKDLPIVEVLRSLGRILPEGGS